MSEVAIRVEGLGKSYLIGHQQEREQYTALRDVLASGVRRMAEGLRTRLSSRVEESTRAEEEFWALKGIDFNISPGEVVGIIGRNGAGKSTLLKILSRITEPSTGRVTITGRVASLLEVGTGFHPELTGRENIYLNGAILGMTRAEIRRKFDEIVGFAEVERFLDTPVKRYSSGMYVRLAFAVAAHLEPDILIVDEVLAVGDVQFQKKCLGKMNDVASHGRTVIFVSHNLGSLLELCSRGLLLHGGTLDMDGPIHDVVQQFLYGGHVTTGAASSIRFFGRDDALRLGSLTVENGRDATGPLMPRDPIHVVATVDMIERQSSAEFVFGIYMSGQRLTTVRTDAQAIESGGWRVGMSIPEGVLRPGRYTLAFGFRNPLNEDWAWAEHIAAFEIEPVWSLEVRQIDIGIVQLPIRSHVESVMNDPANRASRLTDISLSIT